MAYLFKTYAVLKFQASTKMREPTGITFDCFTKSDETSPEDVNKVQWKPRQQAEKKTIVMWDLFWINMEKVDK